MTAKELSSLNRLLSIKELKEEISIWLYDHKNGLNEEENCEKLRLISNFINYYNLWVSINPDGTFSLKPLPITLDFLNREF